MSTKRVFANNNNLNFNDYLKYKNGREIIKNIRTKTNSNKNINIFLNYEKFILLTKAYFKYFTREEPIIGIPVDIYNSNVSFIVYESLLSHIKDCNKCRFSKDIIKLYDCDEIKGILYPYGKYIEYKTSQTIFLHNRINLDESCRSIYCKDLIENISLDKYAEIIEVYPSQNNFVTQSIQYDNYNQKNRMDAYAIYPHICTSRINMESNTSSNNKNDKSSQYNNPNVTLSNNMSVNTEDTDSHTFIKKYTGSSQTTNTNTNTNASTNTNTNTNASTNINTNTNTNTNTNASTNASTNTNRNFTMNTNILHTHNSKCNSCNGCTDTALCKKTKPLFIN